MSDYSIAIVPKLTTYPDKADKAQEILRWLVIEDIVKPSLSDCILSSGNGYPVSIGARQIVCYPDDLPFDLLTNGFEIVIEKEIFHTGGNGVEEIICPNCKKNLADEDWDFIGTWYEGASDGVMCPYCNTVVNIHDFGFVPEWGFSDLGFRFWNWPDFINEFLCSFKEKLGCDISVVYQRI